MNCRRLLFACIFSTSVCLPVFSQWLTFEDITSSTLTLTSIPTTDGEEKDIATADFDQNGWADLVIVRKNPFSNAGGRADVLLMNYDGLLIDTTSALAPGFISNPSDARDVLTGDMNGDGWIDIVIANTFGMQPIAYHNRGTDISGNWLGFADSSAAWLPTLTIVPLQFCALWAGDITGNGALDIYMSNYVQSGACDDALLINDGNGHFTEEGVARLGALRRSAFGTSVEIHDMDNDGDQDIVKISTLNNITPWNDQGVYLLFNDGTGNFSNWQSITPSTAKPYMFTITDFDGNGMKDVYVVDDDDDYIRKASAITADTSVTYTTYAITDPRTTGFGGNCKLADLDCDRDLDLGICDVDVDIPPCESGNVNRKYSMMKNDGIGLIAPYGTGDSIWNESTFDFAFLDIDNNGTQDIFQGRCNGYVILKNTGLAFPCADYAGSSVYVDAAATGAADGTSWSDAFNYLPQALQTVRHCSAIDTILIAEGTYTPCDNNRWVSFDLPDGVTLLGGFPAGGGPLSARKPEIFETNLSGDIGMTDSLEDNSLQVVHIGAGISATLDGLVVRDGNANTGPALSGAGLLCSGSGTFTKVRFSGHAGSQAGFVIKNDGTVTFEDCVVEVGSNLSVPPVYSATGTLEIKGVTVIQ